MIVSVFVTFVDLYQPLLHNSNCMSYSSLSRTTIKSHFTSGIQQKHVVKTECFPAFDGSEVSFGRNPPCIHKASNGKQQPCQTPQMRLWLLCDLELMWLSLTVEQESRSLVQFL